MKKNVVAVDLGGSSGRVILGELADKKLTLKEIHRFKEYMINKNHHLYWDINKIFREIVQGLQLASEVSPDFMSIGIDTWGVDFGLVANDGFIRTPFCYRDSYANETYSAIQNQLGTQYLFERTGLHALAINSLFQLVAQDKETPLQQIQFFLLIPDLLNYLFTGIAKAELSIASTTQLLNPHKNQWDEALIEKVGLPRNIFPEIVSAGTILGPVLPKVVPELSLEHVKVINVAAHDTASAVFSIPALEDHLFISSGTWSLLGLEIDTPLIKSEIVEAGFSNEKSATGRTLLLKNLTGLWLIEEAIKDYQNIGESYDYEKIAALINHQDQAKKNVCYFDTEDPRFSSPGGIIQKIQQFAVQSQQRQPMKAASIFQSIYTSLAFKYKYTLEKLAQNPELNVAEKQLVIVGGGSKSEVLCQYTANVLNKGVKSGLSEATAIGNCLMQLKANGITSEEELEAIKKNTAIFKVYEPEAAVKWNAEYGVYKKMMEEQINELSKNRNSSND